MDKAMKTARVGSKVRIDIPNGKDRHGNQQWKEVEGVVKMVEPTHLVVVVNKNYAHPYCAESYRLIKW